mgnify:CR=1 FL=1
MSYEVRIRRQAVKTIAKAPAFIQKYFRELVGDLRDSGPIRSDWPNYSPLGKDAYRESAPY